MVYFNTSFQSFFFFFSFSFSFFNFFLIQLMLITCPILKSRELRVPEMERAISTLT